MTTRLITPPAAPALSPEEARTAARRTDTALDAELAIYVSAFTTIAEHETGRSIINRTYQEVLDTFPDAIRLYRPPIASVNFLKYYDESGTLQTLDPADYELDVVNEGYIVPAPGKSWPATQSGKINAVIVEYVAGYGADNTATPADFKAFIMSKIAEKYLSDKENPYLVCLLESKKVWG